MRIRLDNPAQLPELLAFLRRSGAIAFTSGEGALEVLLPDNPHQLAERLELEAYLQVWRATHPDAVVEIVQEPS